MSVDAAHTRGLVGALLLFAALGLPQVAVVPAGVPQDEPRHAAYALEVAYGRLPLVTDPLPTARLGLAPLKRTNIMAAANHPPLYYALVGPFIRWGSETGRHDVGLRAARAATLLMGAAALAYISWTLRLLMPNRPEIAVTTVAMVAILPAYVNVCALVHNDALAVLTATGLVYAVSRWLVAHDHSPRQLAIVSAWAAAVALTRFSGLLVLAPIIALIGCGTASQTDGPWVRRLARGVAPVAAVSASVIVMSGWFYARNYALYGDVTGGKALFGVLEREPHGTVFTALLSATPWTALHDHVWTRLAGGVQLGSSVMWAGRLWLVLGLAGLLRRLPEAPRLLRSVDVRDPRSWVLLGSTAAFALVGLSVFAFYAKGGNPTARYWFPLAWVPVVGLVAGWSGWGARRGLAVGIVFGTLLSAQILSLYTSVLLSAGRASRDFATARAFTGDIDLIITPLAFLSLACGLVAVLDALAELTAPPQRVPNDADASV